MEGSNPIEYCDCEPAPAKYLERVQMEPLKLQASFVKVFGSSSSEAAVFETPSQLPT